MVGAGSGGCVAARRLFDAGHEVTLVEAGPELRADDVPEEIAGGDTFAALSTRGRAYDDVVARRTTAGPVGPYARGRGVGGSSAVNAMVALRGDPRLYDSWGWDRAGVDDAWSRVLIPEQRPSVSELGRIDRLLLAATDDARVCPLTRRDGRRVTSAEAYLWPVIAEPAGRFQLIAERTVDRVVFDGSGAATGLVLVGGDEIHADAIVLAAGAIHTPTILLRSGVAGVGIGLRDHPAAGLLLRLRADARTRLDPARRGLVAASTIERDGIQILALNHLGAGAPADLAMLLVALMRPTSDGGSVRLRSDDPTVAPIVEFALLDRPEDRSRLGDGVRRTVRLLERPPFSEVVDAIYIDDRGTTVDALADDDAVERWLVRHGADYVHATSSAASALDDDGAVRDHEAVYVCDASAFPGIPDANTHLPTTMLAERLAVRWPGMTGSAG